MGTSCDSVRAIGDHDYRAIGDRILMLSGTDIDRKSWAFNDLARP